MVKVVDQLSQYHGMTDVGLLYGGFSLFPGSYGKGARIGPAAFHLAQLPTHGTPLENADNDRAQPEKRDSEREPNHPAFGALNATLTGPSNVMSGGRSSPHGYNLPGNPPRAANSHSASVGRRTPAHSQ